MPRFEYSRALGEILTTNGSLCTCRLIQRGVRRMSAAASSTLSISSSAMIRLASSWGPASDGAGFVGIISNQRVTAAPIRLASSSRESPSIWIALTFQLDSPIRKVSAPLE